MKLKKIDFVVRIRLHRFGKKKSPFYRIVVVDSRKRRDSNYIDQIGIYNPVANESQVRLKIEKDKAEMWLNRGARPTETVYSLFSKENIKIPGYLIREKDRIKKDRQLAKKGS